MPSPSCTPGSAPGTALTPNSTLFTPTENLTVLSLLNSESPVQQQAPAPPALHNHRTNTSAYQPHQEEGISTFVYQQPPGEPVLWPLEHEQEAMLLQHYIENVALFVGIPEEKGDVLLTVISSTWSTLEIILGFTSSKWPSKTVL